jgi:Sulfatase
VISPEASVYYQQTSEKNTMAQDSRLVMQSVRKMVWNLFLILATFAALLGKTAAQAKKPNVVYFLVDNLGIGELSVYSGGPLRGTYTPHIDAFAAEGMRLLNFAPETQCTPSRSALMTGRYSIRSGIKPSRWQVRTVDW